MILRDAISVSLDNLRQARLRTALTTLGVAIGVGFIVGMLAIAIGLQDNLYNQLLRVGFFRRVNVVPQFGRDQQPARLLDENALTAIRQIPGVKSITQEIRLPVKVEIGDKSLSGTAHGITLDDSDEAVFSEIRQGRFFAAEDSPEVILTSHSAKTLGFTNAGELVGKTLRVSVSLPFRAPMAWGMPPSVQEQIPKPEPMELRVAGVVERERAVFGDPGARFVFIPQKLAEQQVEFYRKRIPMLAAMSTGVTPIQVRLHDARDLERVEKQIRDMGYRTFSVASIISNMRRAFLVIDMLLALIGSVALVVACLGIVNTMVMAVLERTREIGVMKAVGAEDGDIRRIFLTECAIIGALGGVGGLVLAWVLGRAMNYGANLYITRQGFRACRE